MGDLDPAIEHVLTSGGGILGKALLEALKAERLVRRFEVDQGRPAGPATFG